MRCLALRVHSNVKYSQGFYNVYVTFLNTEHEEFVLFLISSLRKSKFHALLRVNVSLIRKENYGWSLALSAFKCKHCPFPAYPHKFMSVKLFKGEAKWGEVKFVFHNHEFHNSINVDNVKFTVLVMELKITLSVMPGGHLTLTNYCCEHYKFFYAP
jgi:hypothetical protein